MSNNPRIAIIGMSCRFPGGANNPDQLWKLLCDRTDAIADVPPDRWETDRFYHPDHHQPGRHVLRQAGFVSGVDRFDAAFFGISPREAQRMDPQQRFLLEAAWEALESAAIPADQLAGERVGVFVGISSNDYHTLQTNESQVEDIDTHSGTGGAISIIANRVSYAFDFRGPSMAVDTACSSSLVAVHLACEALLRGECELALAAGVNLILAPHFSLCLSQAGMLSPRWRGRAFDAGADGYARGEGVGVVVLKPLEAALRSQDRVHAVIRGTSVNQDGKTPGITMPSADAQRRNIECALAKAGIAASEVAYVEAHGTGTPVGDPIEAEGLGRAFSTGRSAERPLLVGSIKTNIGHLESAAGIAGLIKAALVVERGHVPASLHFESPNPRIPVDALKIQIAARGQELPAGPRIAGVNSFGFGGTNAHALVEAPSPAATPATPAPHASLQAPYLLPVSARSSAALAELMGAWEKSLEHGGDAGTLCAAAARRRSHHPFRRAVLGGTREELRAAIEAARASCEEERAPISREGVVFAFSGQGPQWWAMGRQLLEEEPVFRAGIERCDLAMRGIGGWSLLDELLRDEKSSRIGRTEILQPALFAIQVALVDLWRSWGIEPGAVVGHSMGEMAAAYAAGALSLEEVAVVIHQRGRIQSAATPSGGMAYVALPASAAVARGRELSPRIWIGAQNSPVATTLTGDRAALEALVQQLEREGVFARMVQVNCACHSEDMDPLKEELFEVLGALHPREGSIPFFSTVTGARLSGTELDEEYWWQNFRRPVAFAPAIEALLAAGFNTFVEIGPHTVLQGGLRECAAAAKREVTILPSLLRGKPERARMLASLGALYEHGASVSWAGVYPGAVPAPREPLPAHPWRRESFWGERESSRALRIGAGDHPLLERRLPTSVPIWQTRLDRPSLAWVNQHVIQGEIVVPGALYLETALAAAHLELGGPAALEDVSFRRVCVLPEQPPRILQIALAPASRTLVIRSRAIGEDGSWVEHATGAYAKDVATPAPRVDLARVRARCAAAIDVDRFFPNLVSFGYAYGPAFRGLVGLWAGEGEYLGRVEVPSGLGLDGYRLHPAVLDACLQVMLAHTSTADRVRTVLPVGLDGLRVHAPLSGSLWAHGRLLRAQGDVFVFDLDLVNDAGEVLAVVRGLTARAVAQEESAAAPLSDHLYANRWVSRPLPGQTELAPARFFVPPRTLLERMRPEADRLYRDLRRARFYEEVRPRVDALCAEYAQWALLGLGVEPESGLVPASILEKVEPKRRGMLGRLLGFLVEDGVLDAPAAKGWRVRRWTVTENPEATWRRLVLDHPEQIAELELLRRCGEAASDVLLGRRNPLEIIFPDGTLGISAGLYQDAPVTRVYNLLARRVVEELVERLPAGRTLRVLEIGAGTGGLTGHLVAALPAERTRYVFSDVSPHFLAKARDRFSEHAFFEYRILDIEQEPQPEDLGGFDLVLASDAVHATSDLHRTLTHARRLLAPGGMLLLIEATPPARVLDLTFGMTDGWWSFTDTSLRSGSPLLDAGRWEKVLREAGFASTASMSEVPSGVPAQSIVLAQNASEEARAAAPASDAGTLGARWLVLGDRRGLGASFADRLRAASREVSFAATPDAFSMTPMPTDVIAFFGADEAPGDDPASLHLGCAEVVRTVQRIVQSGAAELPRLWLVTAGAWPSSGEAPRIAAHPLWGLGATLANELPGFRATLVDLPAALGEEALDALWRELHHDDGEREVRAGDGQRLVRRLVRAAPAELTRSRTEEETLRGKLGRLGSLDTLRFHRIPRSAPGAGEVEIEIRSASFNFRDLMVGLGLVPVPDATAGLYPAAEAAGVVTRVGPEVTALREGDTVLTLSAKGGRLSTRVIASLDEVYAIPRQLDPDRAAGLPTTYLTALYALRELARVERGEKVLIHSASGGFGLAAVAVTRLLGGEVLATAGNAEKRAFLRAMGIEHVMDSRSLSFADEVRERTGGRGVDVVLNSLSGSAIAQSLRCLAPYGRFVELGKRDILENTALGLRPFARNLSYHAVDVSSLLQERPAFSRKLLEEIIASVASGRLPALPCRTVPFHETLAAVRALGAGKHVGKILASPIGTRSERALPEASALALDPSAAYLVTGGLSGFGLALAEWLGARGARHLVLAGRRGKETPEAGEGLARLSAAGVSVEVEAIDVSDDAAVRALIDRAHRPDRPLKGVFHAAMVLEDVPVLRLDAAGFERVFAPKARGAWSLHRHTRHCPIEQFVLFSSASALVGNPGQAAYVAANAFLDGLAALRRARGLPALSINWGMLGEVGYVARNAGVGRRLQAHGMKAFTPAWAFAALESLLAWETVHAGVIQMDWAAWLRDHGDASFAHPKYERLRAEIAARPESGEDGDPSSSKAGSLEDRLHGQVARILGLAPARLDRRARLSDLGVDSLLAAEIGAWLRRETGSEVSVMTLMKGPTIAELAAAVQPSNPAPADAIEEAPAAAAWTACLRPVKKPRVRLICLPYLGGGASVFQPWRELAPDVEVHAVQIPGYDGRLGEPAFQRMDPLVDALLEHLKPLLDAPWAVYGHSLGARTAWALALRAERELGRPPVALFPAAFAAPHRPHALGSLDDWPDEALDQVTDAALIGELERWILPEGIRRDPETLRAMMPAIRASFLLGVRHRANPGEQVSCRVHAFAASDDPSMPSADVLEWQHATRGRFSSEVHQGGHLFLGTAHAAIGRSILRELGATAVGVTP